MCGIAGIRAYGPEPITAEEIKTLLCKLEHRGTQATGIALLTAGKIHAVKDHVPAWSFTSDGGTADKFLDEFLTPETTIAILHTRWATTGNPENNNNNHPLYKDNTAIVHNGMISNHNLVFTNEKMDRACETDSDVIRALIDKYGMTEQGLEKLNQMSGSAAIAAISEETPDTLLLARSGSPLTYGVSKYKLWWASEMGAIQAAVRPWVQYHGLYARSTRTDVSYFTMPDHTAYLLAPGDKILRRPFKSCGHYVQPDYARTYDSYGTRMRGFRADTRREESRQRTLPTPTGSPAAVTVIPPVGRGYTHKIAPCPKCGVGCKILKEDKFTGWTCSDKKCGVSLAPCDELSPAKLRWSN